MLFNRLVISALVLRIYSAAILAVTTSVESEEIFVSRGLFTKHCGPGQLNTNVTYKSPAVREIDECCRVHDECPDYIATADDYQRYPELVRRPIPFTKVRCDCDYQLLMCLERIDSFYARSIRQGYITVQHKCFRYDYPVRKCLQSSSSLLFGTRCNAYLVDVYASKRWQWFDIPVNELNEFPRLYFTDYFSQGIALYNDLFAYT